MNDTHRTVCVLIGLAALVALYYAIQESGGPAGFYIPPVQTEAQFSGLGLSAGLATGAGTPLDLRPETHFWAPGSNPRDADSPQPVVQARHRYPVVPGGNISTMIHRGWSQFSQLAPVDNCWFETPPEDAII